MVGIVLIALLALTPLISSNSLTEYFLLPRTLLWSATAIGAAVLVYLKLKTQQSIPFSVVALLMLFIWMMFGKSQVHSIPEWAYTSSRIGLYLAVFLLATALFRSGKLSFSTLGRGLTLFALLGSIWTLSQFFKVNDVYAIVYPFGHKNFASAALLVSALGALYTARTETGRWRILAWAAIGLSLLVIVLLRTRGVWIGLTLAFIILVLADRLFRPKEMAGPTISLKLPVALLAVTLIGITLALMQPGVGEKLTSKANIYHRFTYWDHSAKMAEESPVFGVGAGQWKIHFPKYGLQYTNRPVAQGETAIVRPHNDYLWMLSETGYPGALFYIGFWALILTTGIRRLRTERESKTRLAILSAVAMIIGFLAYGMGEFPIERVDITIPTILAAAFLASSAKGLKTPRFVTPILAGALAFWALYVAYGRYKMEPLVLEVLKANSAQQPAPILQATAQIDYDVYDMDLTANPIPYFEGLAQLASGNREASKNAFDASLAIHPWHVITMNQYGNWYKMQGILDSALAYYQRAIRISPANEALQLNRSEVYLRKGWPDQAATVLIGISPDSNPDKYHGLLIQSLRQHGNKSTNARIGEFIKTVQVSQMSDRQLIEAFEAYKLRRLEDN